MIEFNLDLSNRFVSGGSSKGNQLKWRFDDCYIKADTQGYESISEALTSEFLRYVKDFSFVDYRLCLIHENEKTYYGCYSKDFLKGRRLVQLSQLLALNGVDVDSDEYYFEPVRLFNAVFPLLNDITGLDMFTYIGRVLQFDWLVLNDDRHFGNLCVIYDNGVYSYCPLFDNGRALLSELEYYDMEWPLEDAVGAVRGRPFDSSFKKQCKLFSLQPLRIDIKSFLVELNKGYAEFKEQEFERAKSALLYQLKRLEGVIWTPI